MQIGGRDISRSAHDAAQRPVQSEYSVNKIVKCGAISILPIFTVEPVDIKCAESAPTGQSYVNVAPLQCINSGNFVL